MVFRRRGKDGGAFGDGQPLGADQAALEAVGDSAAEADAGATSGPVILAGGPWDLSQVTEDKIERVDLGGVQVPIVDGMELRAEIADERVVAATLIIERSAIQIQPFAAPRTMGIWDEVRQEIASGIAESGGEVTEAQGRFGTELVATVPVGLPDGTSGFQVARFLGVDGPRWFLRAVITGEAAVEEAPRVTLEDLFAEVIVVRGADAMAPRDPIELRLPEEITAGIVEAEGEDVDGGEGVGIVEEEVEEAEAERRARLSDFNPFERGPEITEIR